MAVIGVVPVRVDRFTELFASHYVRLLCRCSVGNRKRRNGTLLYWLLALRSTDFRNIHPPSHGLFHHTFFVHDNFIKSLY